MTCNVFLRLSVSGVSEGSDVIQSVLAFVFMSFVCCLNVVPLSKVSPRTSSPKSVTLPHRVAACHSKNTYKDAVCDWKGFVV